MRGLRNPYAFADLGAAQLDLDVRWTMPALYVQTEVAATVVRSAARTELDDVFVAAGVGTTAPRGVQVAAELRVVQEPTGA